jgi:hypothetical protein
MRPRAALACFSSALCVLAYGMVDERLIGWQGEVARDSWCVTVVPDSTVPWCTIARPEQGAAPFVARHLTSDTCPGVGRAT